MRIAIGFLAGAMLALTACDAAKSPCVVEEGGEVVFYSDCPEYGAETLSNLTIYAGEDPVWSIANGDRDIETARIVYGTTPAGWVTSAGPEALQSGQSYTAAFTYFDAPSQDVPFTAP